MNHRSLRTILTVFAALASLSIALAENEKKEKKPLLSPSHQRIVFLGDSITDGNTYPTLIKQALADAGYVPPICINAGIGGDTAAGMRGRLDTTVLPYKPTLVTVSAGVNDAGRGVTNENYEADMKAIADKLKAAGVSVILLTPSILEPPDSPASSNILAYCAILQRLAATNGLVIADVNKLMQEARAAGQHLIEADGIHPNYEGQKLLARAVLDALGYKDVPLPVTAKVQLYPGVITSWALRAAADQSPPLDDQTAQDVKTNDTWSAYTLPEAAPQDAPWLEVERQCGFALSLDKTIGKGKAKNFIGIAHVEEKAPRTVYFNTGAELQTVWLNGKRIFKFAAPPWPGFHAGGNRIQADLVKGDNVIVIETGSTFFLSITENHDW